MKMFCTFNEALATPRQAKKMTTVLGVQEARAISLA